MKLHNSTDFADHFLRRMVAWCCGQVGYQSRQIRVAKFCNTAGAYSGSANDSRRIIVRIGPDARFPVIPDNRPGMDGEVIADRVEALVAVTAHELAHLAQYLERRLHGLKSDRSLERVTRREEVRVLRTFRANREALLAEWSRVPERKAKLVVTVQEKRAAKARADLDRWRRKLKLAQTKVKKLKQKAAYYEKTLAAKRSK